MSKPSEILLFEFLTEKVNAAGGDDVIYNLELHDTIYPAIKTDRGLRLSDIVGDFSPAAGGTAKEYDVFITIVVFSRVIGKGKADRVPALTDVFDIQQQVYELIYASPTLGTRVCDTVLLKGSRGYDSWDGQPFAVANIPLIINPSGARFQE